MPVQGWAGDITAGVEWVEKDAKYRRILLKISGELLAGDQGYGIHPKVLDSVANEIAGAPRPLPR